MHAVYLTEDAAGHGAVIGFPRMTTCVAVVARTAATLVGWHVPMGTFATLNTRRTAAQGAAKFIEYVNANGPATALYLVGFVRNHNPVTMRNWVNAQLNAALPTQMYDITRAWKTRESDLGYVIFFAHTGAGSRPRVTFKKDNKVGIDQIAGGDVMAPVGLGALGMTYHAVHNRTADYTFKHEHRLRLHFVNV